MTKKMIDELRQNARKLVRELGILNLNASDKRAPQHWHTLIEIANNPNITTTKIRNLLLLSSSSMSRIVNTLLKDKLISFTYGVDKREKYLQITQKGLMELKQIDDFSTIKIKGAMEFLNEPELIQIIDSLRKYADALEQSRVSREQIKIHTLSTSRAIRKQIIHMIENIQKKEFNLPINDEINAGILFAEKEYYYNGSYNFWFAVDHLGKVIGSIGLKRIDNKTAEIKKFFVVKEHRGKGTAIKLFDKLLKSAMKHKFKILYLGTVDILKAAQSFYEKFGFDRINENELPKQFDKCPIDSCFFKVNVRDLKDKIDALI